MAILSEDQRSVQTARRCQGGCPRPSPGPAAAAALRAEAGPAAPAPLPPPRPLQPRSCRLPDPAPRLPASTLPPRGPDSRSRPLSPTPVGSGAGGAPAEGTAAAAPPQRGREAGKGRRREGERKPLAGADPTRTHIPAPPPGNAVRTGGAARGGARPVPPPPRRPRPSDPLGAAPVGFGVGPAGRPSRGRSEGEVAGGMCLPGPEGFPSGFLRKDPSAAGLPGPRGRSSLRLASCPAARLPHLAFHGKQTPV